MRYALVTVKARTEKDVLVSLVEYENARGLVVEGAGEEVWFPSSWVTVPQYSGRMEIQVPDWLMKDKGLE